ncbi:MAG TPA: hypothetical protein VF532_19390 [Candidatus Angelobacter sp.]
MTTTCFHAAYADGGKFLRLCSHQHPTVISAVACMSSAGEYIVAVEDGVIRALTNVEEVEYEYSIYGRAFGRSDDSPFGYPRTRWV